MSTAELPVDPVAEADAQAVASRALADRRRLVLLGLILATAVGTAAVFVLSDTPDKVYLNPWYVDAVVFCAGVYLVAEAIPHGVYQGLPGGFIRAGIGTAIITIHAFQFLFDWARRF